MTTVSPEEVAEFQALVALALSEHSAGRLDTAAEAYHKILALRPDFAEVHNNLGIVHGTLGQMDEAQAQFERALALAPDLADAANNLATVLRAKGELAAAEARYRQAIELRPDFAEAHSNLGSILQEQGKFDEAVACLRQAIELRPSFAEAHNNLGNALRGQGNLDEAVKQFEQALAIQPQYAEAHYNLGLVFWHQDQLDQAVARFEQAVALRPDYAEPLNNLGVALREQLRLTEARQVFERLGALVPDGPHAQLGLGICDLIEGNYERGWPAYEARLRMPGQPPRPNLPRWTGEPLAGRSLLLLAEQGLGDTFQFVRYARLLKERGARVVLACPPVLGRLMASLHDLDGLFILGSADELPRCDFYLPLLSAPGALGTTVATIPHDVPYLTADAELTKQWRWELATPRGFKIAIAWQGSQKFLSDRRRSIPLAEFAPLARLPGVRLISLQKGFGSEQIAAVDFPVLDLSDRLDEAAGPFMDTAAIIRSVDLVVAADTAIAHLAGALGAQVWMALQFSADWRWLLGRDDSPWYPTMQLFRQTKLSQWTDVFDRIAVAVEARRPETD